MALITELALLPSCAPNSHSFMLYKFILCLTQMIKEQMDKKFGSPWHVVVGKAFGYEITYELRNILYIYVGGRTSVLLWKM